MERTRLRELSQTNDVIFGGGRLSGNGENSFKRIVTLLWFLVIKFNLFVEMERTRLRELSQQPVTSNFLSGFPVEMERTRLRELSH